MDWGRVPFAFRFLAENRCFGEARPLEEGPRGLEVPCGRHSPRIRRSQSLLYSSSLTVLAAFNGQERALRSVPRTAPDDGASSELGDPPRNGDYLP